MSKHLMAKFRRRANSSLSMDWQHETDPNLEDLFPLNVVDRSRKTGEQLKMMRAITEAGDHLTVANSLHHPGRWGYTILSQEHIDDSAGIIFKPEGGFEFREPLGSAGHEKEDSGFASPDEAMIAAEQHYYGIDHSGRSRAPQDSGVDYSDLNKFRGRDEISDDFGDIFGSGR